MSKWRSPTGSAIASHETDIKTIRDEIEANMQKVGFYSERVEHDSGEIVYEIHGPRDTFIVFHGPDGKEQCRKCLAAITAPPIPAEKWLPIESAPRDGTKFTGYSPTLGVRRDVSFNKQRQDFDMGFSGMTRDWTHWTVQAPLPKAPASPSPKEE